MELPQKRGQTSRPLSCIIMGVLLIIMMITATASATVESSNGVATNQYTLYSDVPLDSQNEMRVLSLSHYNQKLDRLWLETQEEVEEIEISQDRTSPIYEVYKDGYYVEVSAEIQWIIRDLLVTYDKEHLEKIIFGMALKESTFNPDCAGDGCYGLYQIQKFWIRGANITHFTDDYQDRDLNDTYDATLTLLEMMQYAIDAYGIDITTDQGIKDWLYWHNTGSYQANVNWAYSNSIFNYADELVSLQ